MRLDENRQGRITITDDRGVRYLDVNKADDAELTVALVPRPSYRVLSSKALASIKPISGATVEVPWKKLEKSTARSEMDGVRAGIFQTPFGRSFVGGTTPRLRKICSSSLPPRRNPNPETKRS